MPICTYLTDQEYKDYTYITSDKELNDLFQEVRKKYPNLLIHERGDYCKITWRKMKYIVKFIIYNDLGNNEVQIINFSTGTEQSKEIVEAYLYGFLCGVDDDKSKK